MPHRTLSPLPPGSTSIADFSQCHAGIISHLMEFNGLPLLLDSVERASAAAAHTLRFFRDVVLGHHAAEEDSLFPAVLACAAQGDEREQVQALVTRLTQEHRQLEALWMTMEPMLMAIAAGETAALDAAAVEALVLDYGAHAAAEEADFLPLCRTLLERNGHALAGTDLSHHLPPAPTASARP